mgnify:CR=1 FL=1
MKIGNIELEGFAALAPMAGVADTSFRQLCRSYGAAYTVSELISPSSSAVCSSVAIEPSDISIPSFCQIIFPDRRSSRRW